MRDALWPGKDALNNTFLAGDPPERFIVLGVFDDSKYANFDEPVPPMMYSAFSQHNTSVTNMVARTAGNPQLWVNPLRQAVRSAGFDVAALPVTFEEWENFGLLAQRIATGSVAVLSTLGLLLAGLGLLGAVSYSVSERRRELGLRVALGAQRRQLMQMILRQTLWISGTGVAIGVVLGIGIAMVLRSQFYGVSTVEWRVLIPVSAGMIAASLAIAYISARPWLRVDPLEAVRHS
jgi:putative ABC transport system permease protein